MLSTPKKASPGGAYYIPWGGAAQIGRSLELNGQLA